MKQPLKARSHLLLILHKISIWKCNEIFECKSLKLWEWYKVIFEINSPLQSIQLTRVISSQTFSNRLCYSKLAWLILMIDLLKSVDGHFFLIFFSKFSWNDTCCCSTMQMQKQKAKMVKELRNNMKNIQNRNNVRLKVNRVNCHEWEKSMARSKIDLKKKPVALSARWKSSNASIHWKIRTEHSFFFKAKKATPKRSIETHLLNFW